MRTHLLKLAPVTVYRNPVVVVLLLQSFLLGLVYQSMVYYLPLYLQNAHQFSIIISASLLIPMFVTQATVSTLTGLWISRYKRYGIVIQVGFAMWTL